MRMITRLAIQYRKLHNYMTASPIILALNTFATARIICTMWYILIQPTDKITT